MVIIKPYLHTLGPAAQSKMWVNLFNSLYLYCCIAVSKTKHSHMGVLDKIKISLRGLAAEAEGACEDEVDYGVG